MKSSIVNGGLLSSGCVSAMPVSNVRDFRPGVPWALISIVSPGDEGLRRRAEDPMLVNRLDVAFDDVDTSANEHLVAFDRRTAIRILKFYVEHRDRVRHWGVHCMMGASRSPAIAAAFERIITGRDDIWFKRRTPNRLVYRTLLDEAFQMGLIGDDGQPVKRAS